jgi:hypothetical protein
VGRQANLVAKYSVDQAEVTNWNVRLDPYALPQSFRYHTGLDGAADEAAVVLNRTQATVSRQLSSGLPTAIQLPIESFEGVAVRMLQPGEAAADVTIVIELLHRDPHLSLPLMVTTSMDDVVAEWRTWGRVLAMPLLTVDPDGQYRAVEARIGCVTVRQTLPRRKRASTIRQRPRFLARRRMGDKARMANVANGREITSWE